ncbi:MAG: 50S ribosomal protein L9 [Hyphomicrobiaceae bacterium]|nr:50S ribosomal protein L9 [Hyphomicrobiaceae bacterium]
MQVILLERIGKLGQMGDIVTVKDGFARNYLLPQGKALRATDANKERFESERTQLEARNLELKTEAEGVAGKLDNQSFVAIRQAGDTGQLYGSVSTRDIADLITEAGFSVARHQVQLDKPIKILGVHPLRVTLHPEVIVTVNVNVARSEDEAERQARGEDVTVEAEEIEEEDTIAAEEVFEDEELAKQAEESLEADASEETEESSGEEAGTDADNEPVGEAAEQPSEDEAETPKE